MDYSALLTACPLFSGIQEDELSGMLACLGARRLSAAKGHMILAEGSPARDVGVLLSGSAQLILTDYCGSRTIIQSISAGQLFGETFACSRAAALPVDIVASENCEYLLIDCSRILTSCSHACAFHSRIIFNLLQLVADTNLALHQRALITSKRTTREKLTTYLLTQAKEAGSAAFTIPFDRQGLADYLAVDRSGLCVELSRLKREGVLDYYKNSFRFLTTQKPPA